MAIGKVEMKSAVDWNKNGGRTDDDANQAISQRDSRLSSEIMRLSSPPPQTEAERTDIRYK